jgi:hypothetical protein
MMMAPGVFGIFTGENTPDHLYEGLSVWATAAAAVAIFLAAATALFIANSSKQVRAKGYLGIRLWGGRGESERRLVYCVTNIGDRDLQIDAFMLRIHPRPWQPWRKRSIPVAPELWRHPNSTSLPATLIPGESAFLFSDTPDSTVEDLAAFFTGVKITPRQLRRRLRAFAHTPWGAVHLDVEKTFLDRLVDETARRVRPV